MCLLPIELVIWAQGLQCRDMSLPLSRYLFISDLTDSPARMASEPNDFRSKRKRSRFEPVDVQEKTLLFLVLQCAKYNAAVHTLCADAPATATDCALCVTRTKPS